SCETVALTSPWIRVARAPMTPSPWASVEARATMMWTAAQLAVEAVAPAGMAPATEATSPAAATAPTTVVLRKRRENLFCAWAPLALLCACNMHYDPFG